LGNRGQVIAVGKKLISSVQVRTQRNGRQGDCKIWGRRQKKEEKFGKGMGRRPCILWAPKKETAHAHFLFKAQNRAGLGEGPKKASQNRRNQFTRLACPKGLTGRGGKATLNRKWPMRWEGTSNILKRTNCECLNGGETTSQKGVRDAPGQPV